MTNTATRRAALGCLASVLAAGFALPARASEALPASAVSLAYAEFQDAHECWLRACDAEDEALDRYEPTELPSYHSMEDSGGRVVVTLPNGKRQTKLSCSDENIASLQQQLDAQIASTKEMGIKQNPWADRLRRTLAKIDVYLEERQRRRDALGLDRLEALQVEADDRRSAAADAVLEAAPTTISDLAMQALVALRLDEGQTEVLRHLIAFAGLGKETVV